VALTNKEIQSLPLVFVIWDDPTTEHTGWFDTEDLILLSTTRCYTAGWIVRTDEENYYLIQGWGNHKGEWQPMTDTTIPKGCIKEIRILRKRWAGNAKDHTNA